MSTTISLLPQNSDVVRAAHHFHEAALMITSRSTSAAESLIAELDDRAMRAHWDAVLREPDRRKVAPVNALPRGDRSKGASLSMSVTQQVFAHDGWTCRWCGTPVIAGRAMRRMHLVFPVLFPRDNSNDGRHGLILAATASIDHVLPLARGGSNDLDNLVTACWPCQFARGDWLASEVGLTDPRDRKPAVGSWDGVAWFKD